MTTPASPPASPPPTEVGISAQSRQPAARATLILLVIINLFNYIDRQVLSANLSSIETQFLSEQQTGNKERLGHLATAFMVAYMVLAPLFGWLAERFSRWKIVGLGVILWSLASGASGLSIYWAGLTGYYVLLLTRCFVGVGEAAYGPVAPTMLSDLFPVRERGKILAWFYAAIPVGSAIGYALGGLAGWPWSFYLVVPPGLLLGLWCFFMPEPAVGLADQTQARSVHFRDYLLLLRTPSYVYNTLGMTCMTFAIGGIAHWMPDYILSFRNYAPDDATPEALQTAKGHVGLVFGAIVVVSGLGATLLGGIAGDRLRSRFSGSYFLVSGISMLIAFPAFLGVLYAPFPIFWGLIFVTCFFLFFNTGPTNSITANVTHPALRAQAFAFNILVIHLFGDAISPAVIGAFADAHPLANGKADMNLGFLLTSFLVLAGGVFWLLGARHLQHDTEQAVARFEQAK